MKTLEEVERLQKIIRNTTLPETIVQHKDRPRMAIRLVDRLTSFAVAAILMESCVNLGMGTMIILRLRTKVVTHPDDSKYLVFLDYEVD